MEGVMMRAPTQWAVACRRPDGSIITQRNELPNLSGKSRWRKVPFVRGVLVLIESLSLGFKALSWSAVQSGAEPSHDASPDSDVPVLGSLVKTSLRAVHVYCESGLMRTQNDPLDVENVRDIP